MKRFISPDTLKAYQEAIFSIHVDGKTIAFQVNKPSSEFELLMSSHGATCAALITAYNPYSQVQSDGQNKMAQAQLTQNLCDLGVTYLPGDGRDVDGLWDPEPSLLALNIKLSDAENLAAKFGQNAFVWIETNQIPILKLMFPISG